MRGFLRAQGWAVGYWGATLLLTAPAVVGGAHLTNGGRSGIPGWMNGVELVLKLLAVAAIGVGVARNAPARRWPWLVIAVAILAWTAADEIHAAGRHADRIEGLTLVGLFYLVGFIGLCGALLRMRRSDGNGLAPADQIA